MSALSATSIDGTPSVGQALDLRFSDVVTLLFRIDALEENERIQLHCVAGPGPWQDCSLQFSFKPDNDQVWVDLVHENKAASDDDSLYFSTKGTCYLLSLRNFIEHGQGRPCPNNIKIHFGD